MEDRKIYPILINRNRMTDYYNMLFEKGFNLRIFDQKKDSDIYEYFLPLIRNYMFWTFDISKVDEFKGTDALTKATVCKEYMCNIFYKDKSEVVCFEPGIIFVVTKEKSIIDTFVTEQYRQNLEKINIRADRTYNFSGKEKDKEKSKEDPKYERAHLYSYILQLYKAVYLNKVNKEIVVPDTFDRTRREFVDFTQNVFNVQITDKDKVNDVWAKDLEIDRLYIMDENQFDLLYKNNRLNSHKQSINIFIALLIVMIIIGVILLFQRLM